MLFQGVYLSTVLENSYASLLKKKRKIAKAKILEERNRDNGK
jgi:hypothetical protein